MEAVGDAKGGEDVEVVAGLVVADEDGLALEDGVSGVDGGVDDVEVRSFVRREADGQGEGDAKDEKGQQDRCQEVASSGLGKLEVGHWHENSKGGWFSKD